MSLLLYDILPIDEALKTSSIYLNKSLEFSSAQLMENRLLNVDFDLLQHVHKASKQCQIHDSPFNWFGLAVIKSLINNPLIESKRPFVLKVLEGVLYSDKNPLEIDYINRDTDGFAYAIPLNLSDKLNLYFDNWKPLKQENEYTKWENGFSKAIHLIQEIDQGIVSEINKLIKHILVVYSQKNAHGSMSPQVITGTVYLPDVDDPSLLAECLIHEGLHQYLYRIEHCSPIFEKDMGTKELYYSPWKDEPRPLLMVLHGAFVFTGVALFYHELYIKNSLAHTKDEFLQRIIKRVSQVEIALSVLKQNNFLTPLGQTLTSIMSDYIQDILNSDYMSSFIPDQDAKDHWLRFARKDYLHASIQ